MKQQVEHEQSTGAVNQDEEKEPRESKGIQQNQGRVGRKKQQEKDRGPRHNRPSQALEMLRGLKCHLSIVHLREEVQEVGDSP
jgi:hypothetical protein